MKHLHDKLRDERGVTILMALFALLVAAMVSVVILTAATSNVKQAKADQEMEQNLLALQSAGQVLAENIGDSNKTKFTRTVVTTVDKDKKVISGPTTTDTLTDGSILKNELRESATRMLDSNNADVLTGTKPITVTASSETNDSYSQSVRVSHTLNGKGHDEDNGNYRLTLTLDVLSSEDSVVQTAYVQFSGYLDISSDTRIKNEGEAGQTATTTTVTTLYWYSPTFFLSGETS